MKAIRKHFTFYGRVQGVGFRYRAYYAAQSFGVTGWVKNNFDGSVEIEAEGAEESIDKMLLSIEKGSFVSIEDLDVKQVPLQNDRSFKIIG